MSGEVPDGWRDAALGELCHIAIGGTPSRNKPEYWATDGNGHPWVAISDMREPLILGTKERITDAGVTNSNVKPVAAETVLMSFKLTIGRVAVAGTDLFTNEAIAAFQPVADLERSFLPYWLEHIVADAETDQAIKGVTLNKQKLAALSGILPPLDEQRRIAEVLRSVDEAIAAARDVLAASLRTNRTMRHELLKVAADGNIDDLPLDWTVRPLEALASVERGKFSIRPRNDSRYFGGSTPFIQTGDITSAGEYITSHTQTLNELGVGVSRVFSAGTIMTTIAANIGDFAMATYPVACPDSVVGIEAKDGVEPFWLYSVLTCFKVALDHASTQNAQKNINLQTLRPLQIPVPPHALMLELAETLSAAAEGARRAKAAVENLMTLKLSIQSDLLSGHVRVPA